MFSNHNDYCEKQNYNMTNMNLGSIFAEGVLFDISAMSQCIAAQYFFEIWIGNIDDIYDQ